MMLPTGALFTPRIRLFAAITACAVLTFAFETLPLLVPSILLPIAYLLSVVPQSELEISSIQKPGTVRINV